jgi:hypothetical protein
MDRIDSADGGRIGFEKGGRNFMGDYDPQNTTGWQESGQVETWNPGEGGTTTTSFEGGQGDGNNPPDNTGNNVIDVDWLTPELDINLRPGLNITLERAKAQAQIDLINSIRNQKIEAELSGQIGDKFYFTTGINEGGIGNTNLKYGNLSADFDPNADLQNINYLGDTIGGWRVGGSYYPEDKNLMFNISKTFKHGGLARLL